jgi:hypothetical protein
VAIQSTDAPSAKSSPKASTRKASSTPGRIRASTHVGERPARTSGIIDATNTSWRTPAATDQHSLRLARRSPVRAMKSAPTAELNTGRSGATFTI